MKRLLGMATAAVAAAALVAVPVGASLQAKTKNPCKVLKTSEIESVLGQTTGPPVKDVSTPVVSICNWEVEPYAEFPEGTVSVQVMTIGAKIAYDTNSMLPGTETVSGLGKAYYDPRIDAVAMLKGKVLLTVQAVFVAIPPIDRKDDIIELAKIARKRV